MLTTRLTEKFGLRYPIVSAPMAGHSGGRLAAAVSEAGGLGLFGATRMSPERLRSELDIAARGTTRPYGVGFITMALSGEEAQFQVALESGVRAMAFSFGEPAAWVTRAKDAGIAVLCQVQSLEGAREAVDTGADVIAVQGREAGGHAGPPSLLPLLEEVLDAFPDQTVIAAGGIASGRTLAAVLAAGADGAWVGTRLLATPEAEIPDEHKQLIVEKRAEDTVFTPVYDILAGGRWPRDVEARLLRNKFAEQWIGRERELEDRLPEVLAANARAAETEPLEYRAVYMGTGVNAIHSIEPAADVIRTLCEEAEARLSHR